MKRSEPEGVSPGRLRTLTRSGSRLQTEMKRPNYIPIQPPTDRLPAGVNPGGPGVSHHQQPIGIIQRNAGLVTGAQRLGSARVGILLSVQRSAGRRPQRFADMLHIDQGDIFDMTVVDSLRQSLGEQANFVPRKT